MSQSRERRVTFSAEDTQIGPEAETRKKDNLNETPPSPILKIKPKPNSDLIQPLEMNFEDHFVDLEPLEEFLPKESTDSSLLDSQSSPKRIDLDVEEEVSTQVLEVNKKLETEDDDYNTARLLRDRSRQLMRQYILHRDRPDSTGHSTSDNESHEHSFRSEDNISISNVHEQEYGESNGHKRHHANQSEVNSLISKPQKLKRQSVTNIDDPLSVDLSNQPDSEMMTIDVTDREASTISEDDSWNSHSYDNLPPTKGFRSNRLCISQMEGVDRFAVFDISSSKQNWGQKFLGFNWLDKISPYKFVVLDNKEEVVFVGVTGDKSSLRKGFFDMAIMDRAGSELLHLRRLYAIKTSSVFEISVKKRCRLEVSTSTGVIIGNVEKTYTDDNYYILEDLAGDCLFLIKRNCITIDCPLLWDYEFKILLPDYKTQVGEISWSCLTAQHENFYGTEISFPADLSHSSKSLLLGACFLLNCSRRHGAFLYNGSGNLWWKKSKESLLRKKSKLVSSYRTPSAFENETEMTKTSKLERRERSEDGFR